MLLRKRYIAAIASFLVLTILFSRSKFEDVEYFKPEWRFGQQEPEIVGGHPYVRPDPLPWHPPKFSNSTPPSSNNDRVIVMTALADEDVSWISETLPAWKSTIQKVDNGFAMLHAKGDRIDKGRIADAYLAYIIENYHDLPFTMVFLNSQQIRYPHSTEDAPEYDRIDTLRHLNIDSFQRLGFANLRCISISGCTEQLLPFRNPPDEFRTVEIAMLQAWKDLFQTGNVPHMIATPCCGEFAVTREQVKKRKVEEYMHFWKWLNKNSMSDDTAGLVLEYLWHVIFGQDTEYCPELKSC